MRKLALALAGLLISQVCFAETMEFQFAKDYIKGFQCRKVILEKGKATSYDVKDYADDSEMVTTFMKNFRLANNEFERAKIYLKKYTNSNNKDIAFIAKTTIGYYDMLIDIYNRAIKMYEYMYSPQGYEDWQKYGEGKMMGEQSKLFADQEGLEKELMDVSIAATHLLVSDKPDNKGLMSYLAITKQEREELIKDLEIVFGPSIKDGLKAGMSYLDASGAAYFNLFNQPYKCADER